MHFIRRHLKLLAVGASSALIAGGASVIATAGASTTSTSTKATHLARPWRLVRRAVHGDLVVATKTGLVNVSFDRGVVQSVSGQQLTLTEGAKTSAPKTVALTIPLSAVVRDNRRAVTLASVTQGQRVLVVRAPDRTYVIARTPRSA